MNFGTSHDTAPDGATVNSTVTLLLSDTEPFPPLPWEAVTRVNYSPMCTSHHATRAEADAEADKMHAAYIEVHS